MHGPLTENNISQFKADLSFMGADSVDSKGNIYTDDLRVINIDKHMAANAARTVIIADSSKFATSAICKAP